MIEFDREPYPGRPKILFVGWPATPHTHRWVDLLKDSPFNVRVFCLDAGVPPDEWWPSCYVTDVGCRNGGNRRILLSQADRPTVADALVQVIESWRPDVVHTLGIDKASTLFYQVRQTRPELDFSRWIVQARGGPDLALFRYAPLREKAIREVVTSCDHFIADNQQNYEYVASIGISPAKLTNPGMGVVPGPGGLDIDAMRASWDLPPSKRGRLIVWPKAYEMNSAKAMPVFEAILSIWNQIEPCRIEMLWMVQPEVQMWYNRLFSPEMQQHCVAFPRLTHQEVLEHLANARVMLAPSLLDGIPNAMLEAMALGAVPIVSPLETIASVVTDRENVLFARNLYPNEIATAIARAMTDDELVDRMAVNNLAHVRRLADRDAIRRRALDYYEEVAYLARARQLLSGRRRSRMEQGFYFRSQETSRLIADADPGTVTRTGDRIEMRLDGSAHAWIGTSGQCPEDHRVAIGIGAASDTGLVRNIYLRTGGANQLIVTPTGCEVNGSVAATEACSQLADERIIKESLPISDPLKVIQRLSGRRFFWHRREDREFGGDLNLSAEPQIGFVAQEVEQVLPEAVTRTDELAPNYVKTAAIVPLLVEALKAQQAMIGELAAKVEQLSGVLAVNSSVSREATEPR
jgi:hypothetical protein